MSRCTCGQNTAGRETGETAELPSAAASSTWMSVRRGVREGLSWILPSLVLAFMPKCPVCVAGYVALGTGIGLSLSTAATLRQAVVLISFAVLGFLAVRLFFRGWPRTGL